MAGNVQTVCRDLESRVARRLAGIKYGLDPSSKALALTFDDGPQPDTTPVILDLLAEYGAHATFFVLGDAAAANPALIRRILEEGHGLGSHSARHLDASKRRRSARADLHNGHIMVQQIAGTEVQLYRPPYGAVTLGLAQTIRAERLTVWLWTRDLMDWHRDADRSTIVEACRGIAAGDVLLLHDAIAGSEGSKVTDRSATIAALPELLRIGHDQGLRWITLHQ
jgi:peptidoglycan/xylan/chitin deacetylase (PgdA/CDA1 family)